MQVTMGANCWDGVRRKSLQEVVKVEVIDKQSRFKDRFMEMAKRVNDPKIKMILGYSVPLMFLASGLPPFGATFALAQSIDPAAVPAAIMSDSVKQSILHVFDPLINLIMALSYPIAGVMIAGGCLCIMVGNRERGMQMMQNAAIGYILVQLSPMLLKLLVGIGSSV